MINKDQLKTEELWISIMDDRAKQNIISDIEHINKSQEMNLSFVIDESGIVKWLKISGFTSIGEVYAFGQLLGRRGHV